MRVPISNLVPGPFRDFDLYPIDPDQVARLKASVSELGFFSSVTVRPHPEKRNTFEIVAGYHRVEAGRQAGLTEVEAICENYPDEQAVAIMTAENMTQRGFNAASMLDSVAAYAKLVSYDILSGAGPTSKILEVENQLAQNQARIASDGPGMPLLYRAINSFDREDRAAHKDRERITSTQIDSALATLKQSGAMAKIVADANAKAEALLAQKAEQEAAEAQRQGEAEKAREIRETRTQQKTIRATAVKRQGALPVTYDARCSHIFRLPSHEAVFRKAVLSPNGRQFIARDEQLPLAKAIRAQIDGAEKKSGRDLGSVTIDQFINAGLEKAMGLSRTISAQEKAEKLATAHVERINDLWTSLRRDLARAETTLDRIVREQSAWSYKKHPFPMDMLSIDRMGDMATRLAKLKKALGL